MIRMSKKVIGAISATSAALITGTTVAANVLIKNENGAKPNTNPLNRDKTYHHYSLVNKIATNEKINNLIGVQHSDSSVIYIIEEQRFLDNIKNIVQETLKSIPAFAQNYLNYTIDCHYKITTKSILIDLLWYLKGAKNKYFDQFELVLQTA